MQFLIHYRELLGWVGSILLAFCAAPQAWHSFKNKSSNGITWGMILMWFFGELCVFAYICPDGIGPLFLNYLINIFLVCIILWYKIYDKKLPVCSDEI